MTDEDWKRIDHMLRGRRSAWFAPGILLAVITYVAPLVFVAGKLSDRLDHVEAAQRDTSAGAVTEKEASMQFKDIDDKLKEVKAQIDDLRNKEESLAVALGRVAR